MIRRGKRRLAGFTTVLLISILSLEAGILLSRVFQPWEDASADLRMRWRHALSSDADKMIRDDVVLLAIDRPTTRKMGKYGAGQWVWRKPFYDQLTFFEVFLEPEVMAYDFIFPAWREKVVPGGTAEAQKTEALDRIAADIRKVSSDRSLTVEQRTLADITRFSLEQGTVFLTHRLASIREKNLFEVVMGYHFRGGDVDPQPSDLSGWSQADIREKVLYLADMAIPRQDIHFPSKHGFLSYGYSPKARMPAPGLLDYCQLGFINGPREPDGVIRRIPLVLGFEYYDYAQKKTRRVFVPSFSLVSVLLYLGLDFPLQRGDVEVVFGRKLVINAPGDEVYSIPMDASGKMHLNFRHKINEANWISFEQLARDVQSSPMPELSARAARWKSVINGNLVVAGLTTTGHDVAAYPLSIDKPVPAVHVHLTALSNILNKDFIARLRTEEKWMLWAVLFASFTLVCQRVTTAHLGPVAGLFLILYVLAAYAGVHLSWKILPLIGPGIYITVCAFGVVSYRFCVEERDRRKIRKMFSTMVSDKVLDYLEDNPDSFSLKGQNREVTVFFSDISGFTTISEKLSPTQVTEFLNTYLTPVTDCIMDHGGYVDKYIGDGIMAIWGAPYPDPGHATKACMAALAQQKLLRKTVDGLVSGREREVRVRMGLASGVATAGNMGSERKFQYTVMGDVVNVASRLEPANKDFGTSILISESTYNQVRETMLARPLGEILVAGRKQATFIYELMCMKHEATAGQQTVARSYAKALELLQNRQWDSCITVLDEILREFEDRPSEILRARAMGYRKSPPPDSWHGEYVRRAKL